MGLFDQIFGNRTSDEDLPDIRFGRYSDAYKTKKQFDAWDKALELFDEKAYLDAYESFFTYLRDNAEDNVHWQRANGQLKFDILQGSKHIYGFVSTKKIRVEAKIVKAHQLHVGFMKRLSEQNFNLEYSRFSIDPDNCVTIVFDSFLLDGSPYKFYYALKELAINADKQDDLLLDEFEGLSPIEMNHLVDLPETEKLTKYNFIQDKISGVLDYVEKAQQEPGQYAAGLTYLLLDLIYRLDFLIKPEGFMMETLERINRQYLSNELKTGSEKVAMMKRELKALAARPKEDFFKEMYLVRTTFGITKPINIKRIGRIIDGEIKQMQWYRSSDQENIALAVPGYIVGNCLFNYAVPKFVRDFFRLYYEVMEPGYFQKLGFNRSFCDPQTNKLNARSIKREIRNIIAQYEDNYDIFRPDVSILDFSSTLDFAFTYLLMIKNIELRSNS